MKQVIKIIIITVLIVAATHFIMLDSLSAQVPYYPTTSTYPWYFGTTSLSNYGTYPFIYDVTKVQPFFGNTFLGGIYPALGDIGYVSSVKTVPGAPDVLSALLYYQYLSYAYQFYQIARVTPLFYMSDVVADYIGSSLYSYINTYNLTPQEGIISFIQQNLL